MLNFLWKVFKKDVQIVTFIGAIALSYPPPPYCYWWLIMKKRGWKLYRSPNPNPRGVRKCNSAPLFIRNYANIIHLQWDVTVLVKFIFISWILILWSITWKNGRMYFNPLSADPTKWSYTLKQFVGCWRQIVWLCILWGWHLKG